jgi:hypothetical protein
MHVNVGKAQGGKFKPSECLNLESVKEVRI